MCVRASVRACAQIRITQICFISFQMLHSNEKIRFNIKGERMQSDVGWEGLWARAVRRSRGSSLMSLFALGW